MNGNIHEPITSSSSMRTEAEAAPLLDSNPYGRKSAGSGALADEGSRRQISTEFGEGVLSNMRLSRWYLAHCCIMAIASVAIISALLLRDKSQPPALWLVVLDGVVVLSLLIETSIDMTLLGTRFWKRGWNIFDFAVVVLSIIGCTILILECTEVIKKLDDVPAIAVAAIRYVAQIVRVARYLLAASTARESQTAVAAGGDVRFPISEGALRLVSTDMSPFLEQRHSGSLVTS